MAVSSPSYTICSMSVPNWWRSSSILTPLLYMMAAAPMEPLKPEPSVYIMIPMGKFALSFVMDRSLVWAMKVLIFGCVPGLLHGGVMDSIFVGSNLALLAIW